LTSSKKTDKSDEIHDSMFKSENVGKTKPRKKQTKKKQTEVSTEESPVGQYVHPNEKRKNNPPVGMVDPNNDPDQPSTRYSYDPRLDPQLQWSGKTENSEFDVDTVSLHIHSRIDPFTIIEKVMKVNHHVQQSLFHYFDLPENNPPLRDAIEFYKHDQNWSNRIISGDSLLVMNSLLEKEGMEQQIQMIYVDPPYGIKYGSNFQPFVNKIKVKDGKDDDLSQEVETIKAFRDTWELGIHSYLSYLRSRILLAKSLLTESGSIFIQISDQNIHLVRILMDEIFGAKNFVSLITVKKTGSLGQKTLDNVSDYLIWYCKNKTKIKYHQLYQEKDFTDNSTSLYNYGEFTNNERRKLTKDEFELAKKGKLKCKLFRPTPLTSESGGENSSFIVEFEGQKFRPVKGYWKTNKEGFERLKKSNRLMIVGNRLNYVRFLDDFPVTALTNLWDGLGGAANKQYVVQTNSTVIERCLLMTTDPGDIVFDPTSGSGTTAYVSEKMGRRWITCDSSRISTLITRQRLMTSIFDFYELKNNDDGISSGFNYNSVQHIMLSTIARNSQPEQEILWHKPLINKQKIRISGPFTLEAVPSPMIKSIDALSEEYLETNQTSKNKQQEWREELLRTGIRGKGGQKIQFSRVESHPATLWLHVDAETKESPPKRVMVSFGPEHSPLEQRQVSKAIEESQTLVPKPDIVIFAALQFDPEAAKDIDELKWPGVTILKAEMNKDLQTQDLKKKQSNNESFWLMGSSDVDCKKQNNGKYVVTVNGFDYYNTKTDEIESGDASKISMWELDIDYDGRSLYPQQVFFPTSGKSGGWSKLAKTLRAEIDDDLIIKYEGVESIPFDLGIYKRIAIKIIDDRGIESLKIIDLE
jgi:adenine-specific DNA-methyltransferase